MYLVPLLGPAAFLGAFALRHLFPAIPEGLLMAFAVLGPMIGWSAYAGRHGARARRAAGLVPAEGGYSAKLLLLATKLRQRADDIDAALRFERELDWQYELESFTEELR